jgi:hypothetical protein
LPTDNEFTKILGWPGYRVYQHAIDEQAKRLQLWVRRKRGNRVLECSGCGRKLCEIYDCRERGAGPAVGGVSNHGLHRGVSGQVP